MRKNMYYFLLGFISMCFIAVAVISYNPEPETEVVCGGCGSPKWWSVIVDSE